MVSTARWDGRRRRTRLTRAKSELEHEGMGSDPWQRPTRHLAKVLSDREEWVIAMAGADEFIGLVESAGRRVFVTDELIDLGKLDQPNEIYVLQMLSASTAAGGKGGGMGDRRVVKVYHYTCGNGECKKVGETEETEKIESLDLPYHATAFPILLPDGRERLVSGVADRALTDSYRAALGL